MSEPDAKRPGMWPVSRVLRIQTVMGDGRKIAVMVASPDDCDGVHEISLLPTNDSEPPLVRITYAAVNGDTKLLPVPQAAWCEVDE